MFSANKLIFFHQTSNNVRVRSTSNIKNFSTQPKQLASLTKEKLEELKKVNPELYANYIKMQQKITAINSDPNPDKFKNYEIIDPKFLEELLNKAEENHKYSVY